MDLATIIGIIGAFGLIGIAMGSSASTFVDTPSLLIVFGGTFGATLVHFRLAHIRTAVVVARQVFVYRPQSPTALITHLVQHAHRARREGILALETAAEETKDQFLRRALELAVDGHEVAAIEDILATELDQLKERHRVGADVFATMGGYAPALGMIGTLVGLVLMLRNMDDPATIGPAMAIALLTTFYGAILANLVFNPIAGKLRSRSAEEIFFKELAMEGVLSITQGDNPRVVEQKLNAFLRPRLRQAPTPLVK